MKTVSVVIGFKDWGLDRLRVSLGSLVPQVHKVGGEVIVVDYGSKDAESVRSLVQASGATVKRIDNGDPWSRSRALNAGFSESTGEILISTDADMIFTPDAIQGILSRFTEPDSKLCILQCKDLPQHMDAAYFAESNEIDFEECEEQSLFRPRYGMGGMIACKREAFLTARGFDERMHTYGGEDIDFAQRLRSLGYRFDWIDDPKIAIYHIWHPSSRRANEETVAGSIAIERNSNILSNDRSVVRNLRQWRYKPADARPAVSIVISTKDRLSYLKEAISSVFNQTIQDFELIVIDDGSSDGTWAFLQSIPDLRLKTQRTEGIGLAGARNIGTSLCSADWIMVHDDDDLMLPTRIEDHLTALTGDLDGTYGGWIDFEDRPGGKYEVFPGRKFSEDAIRFGGRVYLHPTLMLRKSLMEATPYDETFRSGSDLNMALRMLRNGMTLSHTGKIAILRRLHDKQVTHADSAYQKASWATSKQFGHPSASLPQTKFKRESSDKNSPTVEVANLAPSVLLAKYGPDSFAQRLVFIHPMSIEKPTPDDAEFQQLFTLKRESQAGCFKWGVLSGNSWAEILEWQSCGAKLSFYTSLEAEEDYVLKQGLWGALEAIFAPRGPADYLVKIETFPDEDADYPPLFLKSGSSAESWVNLYEISPDMAGIAHDLIGNNDFIFSIGSADL